MQDITPASSAGASPFDGIRRTTPEGREYWSARDLMPLLGYDSWRRFADAIKRAKIAAHTSGRDVTSNFAGAVKISETKPAEDHHLSRFACYLIAMSGDPRKPEVAAALAYFAIRTREAETATSDLTQLSRRDILLMALEAEDRADQQQARAEVAERERDELAPVAGKFLDAEGDLSVRDAAQALTRAGVKVGQNRLFALLDERYGWIKRAVGDGRYRVIQSAIESGYMSVIPQSHYHPKTGVLVLDAPQPRVTPKGVQRILVDHGMHDFQQIFEREWRVVETGDTR